MSDADPANLVCRALGDAALLVSLGPSADDATALAAGRTRGSADVPPFFSRSGSKWDRHSLPPSASPLTDANPSPVAQRLALLTL